jgi:nitrate/nitrite-specific signal transduction histidine kinase
LLAGTRNSTSVPASRAVPRQGLSDDEPDALRILAFGGSLRSSFRHAEAARVEVEIRYDSDEFRLRVRDDGKGIDQAILAAQGAEGHYGLRGTPEQATLISEKLVVWSEAGARTQVDLRIPASTFYATARRRS